MPYRNFKFYDTSGYHHWLKWYLPIKHLINTRQLAKAAGVNHTLITNYYTQQYSRRPSAEFVQKIQDASVCLGYNRAK